MQYDEILEMVIKIGDFSKLSKISIRMLRYYDELGILAVNNNINNSKSKRVLIKIESILFLFQFLLII